MTLEEIARLAGVSRSTVSRVVNGDRRVSDGARARVQDVIRRHDYHPNAAARSLASRRMRILGLLVSKAVGGLFTDPFYPMLIQGTADACNAADHNLTMLMDTSDDGSAVERSTAASSGAATSTGWCSPATPSTTRSCRGCKATASPSCSSAATPAPRSASSTSTAAAPRARRSRTSSSTATAGSP